ncbi:MAG: hypothetical protein SFX19_00420 [Alphaproteobacteria bacterium]|nr:hypothetical protein [Alphaproteobacteria bacterium]
MIVAPLRKSILKESIIFTVLIVVFAAIALYLSMIGEEYEQQKKVALSNANQMLAEKRQVEDRFLQVKEGLNDYETSKKWAKEPGLFIDSQAMRDLFNDYQPRFFLKSIGVEMQPIVDLTEDPKYVRKNFVATRSNARVTIETASDEDVYNLIRAMQQELPGFTKITDFALAKKESLSKEIIAEVRKAGTYPAVRAEMTFEWYGLKSTNPDSPFNKYIPKQDEEPAP